MTADSESESDAPEAGAPAEEAAPKEPAPPADGPSLVKRVGRSLAMFYAGADPRSLAALRVVMGTLLFWDVARRLPDYEAFYTNEGWLSNHYAIYAPMSDPLFSVHHAFGTPGEVGVLFALHLFVNFCLIIGWRTKLMQVLAAVLITSLNSRNIMMENGGFVVLNLIAVWTVFLPLGRRFSLDGFLRSMKQRRESSVAELSLPVERDTKPVYSLAITALVLQWFVVYFFNVVHKTDPVWHEDGTALHYFLQQDRLVTPFGVWLREQLSLSMVRFFSWSTLWVEGGIAALLILPIPYLWRPQRLLAWVLAIGLHLVIGLSAYLGPFSWVMMSMFPALIAPLYWDKLKARLKARALERTVFLDETPRALSFGRLIHRLDLYEKVRFEVLEDEKKAGDLVVGDGEQTWTGVEAWFRLLEALPVPKAKFFWMKIPGLSALGARLVRFMASGEAVESAPRDGFVNDAPRSGPARVYHRVGVVFAQLSVALLLVCTGSQVFIENRFFKDDFWLKKVAKERPQWMTDVVVYPRLFQGWSMFAPGPPRHDGRLVVDGRTADGRKLDPLTGQEPVLEVALQDRSSMSANWAAFHTRIAERRNRRYHQGFKDYLLRAHRVSGSGDEGDRLVAFDVWWVHEDIAPYGKPLNPPKFDLVLSHGNVTDSGVPEHARPRRPGASQPPRSRPGTRRRPKRAPPMAKPPLKLPRAKPRAPNPR